MAGGAAFHGVYPMLYAFFNAAGQLDRSAMRRQVQACLAHGAHGVAILGLATEVSKLSEAERHQVLEWVAEDIAGQLPLAVTVYGERVSQQVSFVQAAQAAGAAWVILQPPPVPGLSEQEHVDFFSAVMQQTELPVAIQNAPEYLGVGLSAQSLNTLCSRHLNFTLLKGEGPVLSIRQLVEVTADRLAIFNGRGGLELPDNLRAGCVGMIPAPECFDRQVRIYDLMQTGDPDDEAEAEQRYREILPLIVFVMQSLDTFLCYGKRVTARRLGIDQVFDRAPALSPTAFGLDCVERHARTLGPL